MKCEFCENPATVHLNTLTGLTSKAAKHLCEACAKKHQVLAEPNELNIPAIVHLLLGSQLDQVSEELARLTCPHCGIKYMEFRSEGRLGCPSDYEVFRAGLEPILRRIHRADRHRGKSPPHHLTNRTRQAAMYELHHQLRQAVDAEQYEEAARLRDAIRLKETADEPR
jgi:protein arginine kinase activator